MSPRARERRRNEWAGMRIEVRVTNERDPGSARHEQDKMVRRLKKAAKGRQVTGAPYPPKGRQLLHRGGKP